MKKMFNCNPGHMIAAIAWMCPVLSTQAALNLDDIQFWTGTGTNRAVMLIEWKAPEVFNSTEVMSPIIHKTLAWGYRWNGESNASEMFNAIVANDPQLFGVLSPDTGYGSMIMGLGYDLNNNKIFGINTETDTWAYSYYSNSDIIDGIATADYADADIAQTLDSVDLYWGGVNGPSWELWHEKDNQGGFFEMPQTGDAPYWIPDDPSQPWSGTHGEWTYASMGIGGTFIYDGSWIAFTVSAGGLDYMNPTAPGTVAYYEHKSAPHNAVPALTGTSPYPLELTDSHEPFGSSALYADPNAILGEPTTIAQNMAFFGMPAEPFHIKLVDPAYNVDLDGNKVIVTLDKKTDDGVTSYGSVTVKFDHPVKDDPANPYGIDFQVFGNTMYTGSGFVSDTADMRSYQLTGGAFEEPLVVSVSPDGINWYTYKNGPYADSVFPTHAFTWDDNLFDTTGNGWTKKKMDFTKPVNPVFSDILGNVENNISGVNAIKLYAGSGGGTGYDLVESGFDAIQYVRIEATDDFYGGELDALSDVRPAILGEGLALAPENITQGHSLLYFNDPDNLSVTQLKLNVQSLSDLALITPSGTISENAQEALAENVLNVLSVNVDPIFDSEALTSDMMLEWNTETFYSGDGSDLKLLSWDGTKWNEVKFNFDEGNVILPNISNSAVFALIQMGAPELSAKYVDDTLVLEFTAHSGWCYILEKSATFDEWSEVQKVSTSSTEKISITIDNLPEDKAFYRLRLEKE